MTYILKTLKALSPAHISLLYSRGLIQLPQAPACQHVQHRTLDSSFLALLFFLWFLVFHRMEPLSTWWPKSDILMSFLTTPPHSHPTPISYKVLQLYLLMIFQICPLFSILTRLWGRLPSSIAQIIVTASKLVPWLWFCLFLPPLFYVHCSRLPFFSSLICFVFNYIVFTIWSNLSERQIQLSHSSA